MILIFPKGFKIIIEQTTFFRKKIFFTKFIRPKIIKYFMNQKKLLIFHTTQVK